MYCFMCQCQQTVTHLIRYSLLFPTDAVMDDHSSGSCQAVHIINMDVQDNHDDATIGAFLLCQLCEEVCTLLWLNKRNKIAALKPIKCMLCLDGRTCSLIACARKRVICTVGPVLNEIRSHEQEIRYFQTFQLPSSR